MHHVAIEMCIAHFPTWMCPKVLLHLYPLHCAAETPSPTSRADQPIHPDRPVIMKIVSNTSTRTVFQYKAERYFNRKEGCYAHVLPLKTYPQILISNMLFLILLTRGCSFLTIYGACWKSDILPLLCGLTGGGNRAKHSLRRMSFLLARENFRFKCVSWSLRVSSIIETGWSHGPNPLVRYTPWHGLSF